MDTEDSVFAPKGVYFIETFIIMNTCMIHWRHDSEVTQSCLTLCDHMDCSLPGFSIHGIFQERVMEWVAISRAKHDGFIYASYMRFQHNIMEEQKI